jgi:hypothetical protein
MTDTTARLVEITPGVEDRIVAFVHRLGGPALIRAYDHEGNPIGYEASNEITADEVEVIVVPGTVARLTAEPFPADAAG